LGEKKNEEKGKKNNKRHDIVFHVLQGGEKGGSPEGKGKARGGRGEKKKKSQVAMLSVKGEGGRCFAQQKSLKNEGKKKKKRGGGDDHR